MEVCHKEKAKPDMVMYTFKSQLLRQEDHCKFEAILLYIRNSRPVRATR